MRVLFNGCSWTAGDELEAPLSSRYSALICKKMGWVENNISQFARSNYEIVHTTYEELIKNNYDVVSIQLTFPTRLYVPHINRNRSLSGSQPHLGFYNDIMKYIKSKCIDKNTFVKNYSSSVLLLNEFIKQKNCKIILFCVDSFNQNYFKNILSHDTPLSDFLSSKNCKLGPRLHPLEDGHAAIAEEYLLPMINKLL